LSRRHLTISRLLKGRPSASPIRSPIAQASPLTPVKPIPISSPKAVSPRSPTYYQPAKSTAFTVPLAPLPPPATTAQDLLHRVMGLGGPPNSGLSSQTHHTLSPVESVYAGSRSELLFGSQLSHHPNQRPSQSIWSASRDEQPLMFNGNSGNVSASHSGGHGSHIYQTSPRQYAAGPALLPSQDMSQPSIWTPSYPSQSQNSQQNYVGALPSASFAQPPQMMLSSPGSGGSQRQQQHQRMHSSSTQNFQLHNHLQNDPFAYSPPSQLPIQRPQQNLGGSASGYMHAPLPLSALGGHGGAPSQYYTTPPATFHSRGVSMHDPRLAQQNYLSPPMSQVWSNTG
jgi:protein SMG7